MKNMNLVTIVSALLILANVNAFAEEHKENKKKFDKEHPRRAQVVNRANREENASNAAAVNGKITDKQAQKLDREDQNIKRQEQRDARQNGGTITKGEQQRLNREENGVNRQRAGMEKRDAARASGTSTGAGTSAAPSAAPAASAAPSTPAGN